MIDPDRPNPKMVADLVATYERSAARLRAIVLGPGGGTASAQKFNQTRAAILLAQVQAEIKKLKEQAAAWTGTAITDATAAGNTAADRQIKSLGKKAPAIEKSTAVVDHRAAAVFARDTVGDLFKAADSMGKVAATTLHRMAATGVSNADVNRILAGGVIEGQPIQAIRELRDLLKKVHGDTVTIKDKNGDPMTFNVGDYAKMVATTKTREATCHARHQRLLDRGLDLVVVTGKISTNFCSAYLGKVFSISGKSTDYPPLSSLPGGGPPFHPNCSKTTAPFVVAFASDADLKAAEPDPDTEKMLNVKNSSELQRRFQALNLAKIVKERVKTIEPVAGPSQKPSKTVEQWKQSLSIDEVKVFKYWSGAGYQQIKDFERGQVKSETKLLELKSKYDVMVAALDRAPNYQGVVYRGIPTRYPDRYTRIGEKFTFDSTSSASKSITVAGKFAANEVMSGGKTPESRIVLRILSKTGKDISSVVTDAAKKEKEVILRKGFTGKIVSTSSGMIDGLAVTFVDVEEIINAKLQ